MNIKYGVLQFSYNNIHFDSLRKELRKNGVFSINLGDSIQTLAVRKLYQDMGIKDEQVTAIDRDALPRYIGEPVALIMNGYFYEQCFPIANQIIPIFIGFCAPECVIKKNKVYFKKYEPIGCRDVETAKLFQKHGIISFTTGCLSLTFNKRLVSPSVSKTFIVYGNGAGELPKKLLDYVPQNIIENTEFIIQRMPVNVFPLGVQESRQAEKCALNLLKHYEEEASLVITPLLHAACPCMALGIPVILARNDYDARFSALGKLLPVYTPNDFSRIDWKPCTIDIENLKAHIKEYAKSMIEEIPKKFYHINALSSIYAAESRI